MKILTKLRADDLAVPLLGLLVIVLCSNLLIRSYGQQPLDVYAQLVQGTLLSPFGLGQMLYKTTPLLFAGLGVALGFRAGLFNIGAEGQLQAGAFAAAVVGASLPAGTPGVVAVGACLLAAFAAGAATAAVPGALKVWTGAHEVITTLMLNFMMLAGLNYLLVSFFRVPETQHTFPIQASARLTRLADWLPALQGSAVSTMLLLGLAACVAVWWVLTRTRFGYVLRASGLSPSAAETAGIPLKRTLLLSFMLSGGIAGLAGLHFVMGYKNYFEEGFSAGIGFMGVAVALLARNHPLAVIPAALLFGWLSQGGISINALVPRELIEILQALLILTLISLPALAPKRGAGGAS